MNSSKPLKSFAEQVSLLQAKGMKMPEWSEKFLSHVNYERIKPYYYNFVDEKSRDSGDIKFVDGADFTDVVACYDFNRELSSLLLSAVAIIEISARTKWAHYILFHNGEHAHLKESSFVNAKTFAKFNEIAQKNINHINKKEKGKKCYVPITLENFSVWHLVEIMSLGDLSFCYTATHSNMLQEIYESYNMDRAWLNSFLHTLTNVRNRCAHQGRIWNYFCATTPKIRTHNTKYPVDLYNQKDNKKIYNMILQMIYLLNNIYPGYDFKRELINLLEAQQHDYAKEMGFIDGWKETKFWNINSNQ